jgi:hypothetical protein
LLEQLEKAKEEKKKIDERIVRLENELASLENSNTGHQPAAPSQHGHGPQERPHTDEERVDVSLENCDGRNEEEGSGEEAGIKIRPRLPTPLLKPLKFLKRTTRQFSMLATKTRNKSC